jgi:hypothetical protein
VGGIRVLTLTAALGALQTVSSHAAAEPSTTGSFILIGGARAGTELTHHSTNAWGPGLGLSGALTTRSAIYLDLGADYFFGDRRSGLFQLVWGGGYDFALGREFVLRPLLRSGLGWPEDAKGGLIAGGGLAFAYLGRKAYFAFETRYEYLSAREPQGALVFVIDLGLYWWMRREASKS